MRKYTRTEERGKKRRRLIPDDSVTYSVLIFSFYEILKKRRLLYSQFHFLIFLNFMDKQKTKLQNLEKFNWQT